MAENMLKRARIDNEELKKHVECPVCMEIPRAGPIYACPNGHLVCQTCKGGTCPVCRNAMGEHTSLLAVAVIEIVLHNCKFEDEGCEEVFKLENLPEHEKICKHRIVSCPYEKCDQKIALSKLFDHLGNAGTCSIPGDVVITNGKAKKQSFNVGNIEMLKNLKLYWQVRVGSHRGAKFALCVTKSGDYYHTNIVMFEPEEICSRYNIEVEVYQSRSSPASSSFKFRGNPTSIDKTKAEVGNLGLSMHREAMEKMVLKDDTFSFTVSFSFL